MALPQISIVIPVHNLAIKLGACLDSCLAQTYKDIEIVVVNDGSSDGSQDVIDLYLRKDSRIVSIKKTNEGVNIARKTGVENACGEYVFFLDGDDIIPSDAIEVLAESAIRTKADIVAGNLKIFHTDGKQTLRRYDLFTSGNGISFLEFILKEKLHYLVGKLLRKSLFQNQRYFIDKELSIGEDQIQLFQICLFAEKVESVNQVVYQYVQHDQSVTQRFTDPIIASRRLEVLAESFFELLKHYPYNDFTRQQINFRIIESLHHALRETGRFVISNSATRKLYRKAILMGIFGKKSLLFSNCKIILRAIFSYLFPITFSKIRRVIIKGTNV